MSAERLDPLRVEARDLDARRYDGSLDGAAQS